MKHAPAPHVLERTPVRWTPSRKEEVLRSIALRKITRDEALARFGLSPDELDSWFSRQARYGRDGLAVTRLQVTR